MPANLTPVQSFIQRFLSAVDNATPRLPGQSLTGPSRSGLLGFIEQLQALNTEGVNRGFIAAEGGSAANPPANSDFVTAGYPAMTTTTFATLAATLQALNTSVTTPSNGVSVMQILYTVRN